MLVTFKKLNVLIGTSVTLLYVPLFANIYPRLLVFLWLVVEMLVISLFVRKVLISPSFYVFPFTNLLGFGLIVLGIVGEGGLHDC